MSPQHGNPAELPPPELGEGGGLRPIPHRPGPGPSELPPAFFASHVQEIVSEVFNLRDRVHALESQLLAARLRPGRPPIHELPRISTLSRFIGGPQELPEGGEGGGGTFPPPREIAELPPFDFNRIIQDIGLINQRLVGLEASVKTISQRLETGLKK